jgi:NADH-quinone oxidoreductase subunit J
VTLSAPFIAAVQVIVYAGAIMVLVVFVIMLLNVEVPERRRTRLSFLVPAAIVMAAVLIAEVTFVLYSVQTAPGQGDQSMVVSDTGLTASIGTALFTTYLLPFEITSVLLLMAIVGAMTLARRINEVGPETRVIPGAQVLALNILDQSVPLDNTTGIEAHGTDEVAKVLNIADPHDPERRD